MASAKSAVESLEALITIEGLVSGYLDTSGAHSVLEINVSNGEEDSGNHITNDGVPSLGVIQNLTFIGEDDFWTTAEQAGTNVGLAPPPSTELIPPGKGFATAVQASWSHDTYAVLPIQLGTMWVQRPTPYSGAEKIPDAIQTLWGDKVVPFYPFVIIAGYNPEMGSPAMLSPYWMLASSPELLKSMATLMTMLAKVQVNKQNGTYASTFEVSFGSATQGAVGMNGKETTKPFVPETGITYGDTQCFANDLGKPCLPGALFTFTQPENDNTIAQINVEVINNAPSHKPAS